MIYMVLVINTVFVLIRLLVRIMDLVILRITRLMLLMMPDVRIGLTTLILIVLNWLLLVLSAVVASTLNQCALLRECLRTIGSSRSSEPLYCVVFISVVSSKVFTN